MELTDYIIGDSHHEKDNFQWGGGARVISNAEKKLPIPFQTECTGKSGMALNDPACEMCPHRHRGICLKAETRALAPLGSTLMDKPLVYPKIAMAILSDLTIKILNCEPWTSLKGHMKRKYAGTNYEEIGVILKKWLARPGLLGFLVIDPDFFTDCRSAQSKISNCKFRPIYALKKNACLNCSHTVNNQCMRLNCQLYTPGTLIPAGVVINLIDAMRSIGVISSPMAFKCREKAKIDPVSALTLAVLSFENIDKNMKETGLQTELKNIGEPINPDTMIFENESPESIEAKNYLMGSEMKIDFDAPPKEYDKQADAQYFKSGAGIDGYLQ
jgi:hypothetical protein